MPHHGLEIHFDPFSKTTEFYLNLDFLVNCLTFQPYLLFMSSYVAGKESLEELA